MANTISGISGISSIDLVDGRMAIFDKYLDRTKMDKKQYQFDGVRWCLSNELNPNPVCGVRGGFVADEMGLGKTIMMIGTFLGNYLRRTLIILPPVLIDQWLILTMLTLLSPVTELSH